MVIDNVANDNQASPEPATPSFTSLAYTIQDSAIFCWLTVFCVVDNLEYFCLSELPVKLQSSTVTEQDQLLLSIYRQNNVHIMLLYWQDTPDCIGGKHLSIHEELEGCVNGNFVHCNDRCSYSIPICISPLTARGRSIVFPIRDSTVVGRNFISAGGTTNS